MNAVTEEVGIEIEKQGQAVLERQLIEERKKRTRLTEVAETWKVKCGDQAKITVQKEKRIRNLTQDMRGKTRAIKTERITKWF